MFQYIFFLYISTIYPIKKRKIPEIIFSLYRSNNFFFPFLLFRIFSYSVFLKVKIKNFIYILLAAYLATFLRLTINNNFFISIIGSFLVGFLISKKLSYSIEKIVLTGFFSCFTSFSGFIYFLYKILNQGDWIKFIIFFNLIIILNLFTMLFGFWISRKITQISYNGVVTLIRDYIYERK